MIIAPKNHIPAHVMAYSFFDNMTAWFFALFLLAGYYKSDPRLSFIQTNVDITLLFLGLSVLIFLYRGIKNSFALQFTRCTIWVAVQFILLVACLAIGLIYTHSIDYGFDKVMRFIFLTGWAFFGAILLITNFLSLRRFCWAIMTISTIMAIDSRLAYPGSGEIGFVTALGSNQIALARASGLGLLTIFAFLLPTERNIWIRLCLWLAAALQLWSMLTAGSRGPVFAFIVSTVLFMMLSVHGFPHIKLDRFAVKSSLIMFFAAIIVGLMSHELFATLILRIQLLFAGSDPSAAERFNFYIVAFNLLASSPLWGIGTGQFGMEITGEDTRLYPHNIILELGAENGLLGILFFITMVFLSIREGLIQLYNRRNSASIVSRYLLVACSFALLNAMVSGDINDNRILFLFLGLLSTIQHLSSRGEKSNILKVAHT